MKSLALGGIATVAVLVGLKTILGGKKGKPSSPAEDDMYVLATPAKEASRPQSQQTPTAAAGPSSAAKAVPAVKSSPPPPQPAAATPQPPPTQQRRDPIERAASAVEHGAQRTELKNLVNRLEKTVDRLGASALFRHEPSLQPACTAALLMSVCLSMRAS